MKSRALLLLGLVLAIIFSLTGMVGGQTLRLVEVRRMAAILSADKYSIVDDDSSRTPISVPVLPPVSARVTTPTPTATLTPGLDSCGPTITVNDTFDGTSINDELWSVGTRDATVTQDDRLISSVIANPANSEISGSSITLVYEFCGDFDAQVDFQIGDEFRAPLQQGILVGAALSVVLPGDEVVHIKRIRSKTAGVEENHIVVRHDDIGDLAEFTTSVQQGRFRIARRGSAIDFYFDSGSGWQRLYTFLGGLEPATIYFHNATLDAVFPFTTYFDNFYATGNVTPTLIATPTNSATSSPTSTYPPPTSTPTPSPTADPFEPDNTCTTAQTIVPDGDPQEHNFHTAGDPDWLRFQAITGTDYIISALAVGDQAHPIIRLYDACDKEPIADPGDTFGFDQIISFRAERDGLYYLKLAHLDEDAYGDDTAYQISVRPSTTGAAIIAGGRLRENEEFQKQITFMTDHAYRAFSRAGYDHDDVYYLSADVNPPRYMDAPTSAFNLEYAITTWAPRRIQDGDPLYVYLGDHGLQERFYANTDRDVVTTDRLDAWLVDFQSQRPNSPVVVIIEACYSGSFTTPADSIAGAGRIVITSTGEDNLAYIKPRNQGGAFFSDAFFSALAQNYDVWTSFQKAEQAVAAVWGTLQTPWIDGDGDGVPYPEDQDDVGAGRGLGLGRLPSLTNHAPFIETPTLPVPDDDQPARIRVKVLTDDIEATRVWMEVTQPSTPPPSAPPGYVTPISHAERVELTYNSATQRFEADFTFDEAGGYQFVFNAELAGLRAQAVTVTKTVGGPVYLPLVAKR